MILYEKNRSSIKESLYHQNDIDLCFGVHLHNSFEFIYVYSGILEVTIDQQVYTLTRGNATIILPNQLHSYKSIDKAYSYLCVFSNSYIYEYYEKIKNKYAIDPIFCLNDKEIIENLQNNNTSHYLIKSYLYYLIDLFDRNTSYDIRNIKLYDNFSKILSYIENNYNQNISLKDISKEVGYDYHYLTNQIQKVLHTTFRSLLNEYRIQHAQNLLLTTSMQITAIATDCGYDSLCSFNRNFKEITTVSPKEYRKNHF